MENRVQSSSDDVSLPQPPAGTLVYAPLHHGEASIRLIRVLATRTHEGYIQCEIRHASIDDSYICLSYLWGEPGKEQCIMVNNSIMRVRCNLHGFLEAATRKERLHEQWLWIDALCIDQTNVAERNHQVQQMGLIYSRAKEVLSWFGDEENITGYLEVLVHNLSHPTPKDWSHHNFINSKYWYRAWITQEIALARKVTLCAGDVELAFALLQSQFHVLPLAITALLPGATRTLKGRSIIHLLDTFDFKDSCDRRDRIYSLLSLCGDGSDLQVDYKCSIDTLARSTLQCCRRSFCLCAMRVVAFAMNLRDSHRDYWSCGTHFSGDNCRADIVLSQEVPSDYFAYITLNSFQSSPQSRPCPFEFCQPCNCKATTLSHTPGFVNQSPHHNASHVVLYSRNLCDSHTYTRIEITVRKDGSHPTWSTIAWVDGKEKTIESGQHAGCTLVPHNNNQCKIYFSFDFLLQIVYRMVRIRPCNRVVHHRINTSARMRDKGFQLCN